jgi:hypothetical protein
MGVDGVAILAGQAVAQYLRRSRADPVEWAVVGRREVDWYAEPIGSDTRVVDNSGSEVELGRSFTISNSAEHQFSLEVEASRTSGDSSRAGIASYGISADLSAHVEKAVKARISATEVQRHSVEERLEFKVPARTVLTISLTWKRIWQRESQIGTLLRRGMAGQACRSLNRCRKRVDPIGVC